MESNVDSHNNKYSDSINLNEIADSVGEFSIPKKSRNEGKPLAPKDRDKKEIKDQITKEYDDKLSILIKNKKVILSYKAGEKAFKSRRTKSYNNFVKMLKLYQENKGIDDLYFFEECTSHRDIYLEWLYGVTKFKKDPNIKALKNHDHYLFRYIVDAPYVYHDDNTGNTYIYIEMHYEHKIRYFLVDSSKSNTNTFRYRAVLDGNEFKSFRNEYVLSQKLAMITDSDKGKNKYIFYHDDQNNDLTERNYSIMCDLKQMLYEEKEYKGDISSIKSRLINFLDVLKISELTELFGLLVNYKMVYHFADYDMFYVLPKKVNGNLSANLLMEIMETLKVEYEIPVFINPDNKTCSAIEKGNKSKSQYITPNICGIIINIAASKNERIIDKNSDLIISYDKYKDFVFVLKLLAEYSFFERKYYNKADKRLYSYLVFVAKHNSLKCNDTSLAAFNGIYCVLSYFLRNKIIELDVVLDVFGSMFNVYLQSDEVDEIVNGVNVSGDVHNTDDSVCQECISECFADNNDSEELMLTVEGQGVIEQRQFNESDIEEIFRLMCEKLHAESIKYDACNDEKQTSIVNDIIPFVKKFKKNNCDAWCFVTENDEPVKFFFKKSISGFLENKVGRHNIDNVFELLYKYIVEHNRSINPKTVSKSDDLRKYNVFSGKKYYVIFLNDGK